MTPPSRFAEMLLTFFEKSMDAIVVFDSQKRILGASPSAVTLLGIPRAELVGASSSDLPVDRSGQEERWAKIQAGESVRSEVILTLPDGTRTAVESVVTPNVLPGVHVSVFRDIGARKERELLSERYELLARHTHDIVLFIDEAGLIVEANQAAERAYGLSRVELEGLPIRELRASPTLGDFAAQLEKAFTTGVLFETEHRRKDGTTFPVEVGSRSAIVGGRRMLLSIIRDITERRLIQARLVQADRLGAFGMIAAGVAHEINTPLAYALNNLEMLARRVPLLVARLAADGNGDAAEELAQIQQMLATAREGMDRVRNISADLKTFSRPGNEHVDGVDVREIVESAINIARGDIRHRAVLVRDFGDIATVRANPPRLGQVFLNLLLNAAQATAVGRTRPAEIEIVTRMDGDTVVVEVSDDGVGIPADLGDRIFEPFVTSKSEGTGLGLYIARSTVREHGGDIQVFARPTGGTSFHVRLPGSARLKLSSDRPRRMVVDDEACLLAEPP